MSQNMEVKSIVKFGQYPYDANGTVQPISWRVLEKTGDAALLLTEYGIDVKQYHMRFENITWGKNSLCHWLNHDFLNTAFTDAEKSSILLTDVSSENITKAKVFLLSDEEAFGKYFDSNEERQCKPTEYAKRNWAYTYKDYCSWWLRSPGHNQCIATYVFPDGTRDTLNVDDANNCVRPALWVDLKFFRERKIVDAENNK